MLTPSAAMVSSSTRIASGSLSTRTPSQSKMISERPATAPASESLPRQVFFECRLGADGPEALQRGGEGGDIGRVASKIAKNIVHRQPGLGVGLGLMGEAGQPIPVLVVGGDCRAAVGLAVAVAAPERRDEGEVGDRAALRQPVAGRRQDEFRLAVGAIE